MKVILKNTSLAFQTAVQETLLLEAVWEEGFYRAEQYSRVKATSSDWICTRIDILPNYTRVDIKVYSNSSSAFCYIVNSDNSTAWSSSNENLTTSLDLSNYPNAAYILLSSKKVTENDQYGKVYGVAN